MPLAPGGRLGPYEIVSPLGAGGMGEVYKARDTRLGRTVAIKVLPAEVTEDPERLERFRREAKALAALSHPNVVTIHEVGEADGIPFLAMELVEGQTLDRFIPPGGMDLGRFLELAIPLTDALATAHERGIVHRDLKPGNVMVTAEGRVKILDFGLAKRSREVSPGSETGLPTATLEAMTREGSFLGSAPYMSPEQIQGEPVDARSDVFSLGIVLQEMLTGRRPFAGENRASLLSSILRDEPMPLQRSRPELPRQLGRIVGLCLEKRPTERFQSARDVRNQLEQLRRELAEEQVLARAPAAAIPAGWRRRPAQALAVAGIAAALLSLALVALWKAPWGGGGEGEEDAPVPIERQMIVVLPFENLGPPEHEYFAAGMTEEITSRLAAVEGLGVISRTSALQYGGGAKSIREIGDELGVDYVLEGTVRWAPAAEGPGRVRISPQLVRVRDDSHLWAGSFDGTLDDVFAVQSQIAGRVIGELQVAVGGREHQRLERGRPTDDSEAYHAYLRGLYRTDRWQLREAVADFESAVERDPAFAQAWAALSEARSQLFLTGEDRSQESRDRALAAAQRSLELDPDLPESQLAVAYYHYWVERDFDRALAALERARQVLPNSGEVLSLLGLIQRRQGRWEESMANLRRALELDPRSSSLVGQVAMTHTSIRDFGEAIRLADQSLALDPRNTLVLADKALARFEQTGDPRQGLAVLRDAPAEMDPGWDDFLLSIEAKLLALAGEHGQALALLDRHDGGVYQHNLANVRFPLELARGQVLEALGRDEEARAANRRAVAELEAELAERPDDPLVHAALGLAHAGLGEAEPALRHAERAVALRGPADDAGEGPSYVAILAEVLARTGDPRGACEAIREVLAIPAAEGVHWFRFHSGFAALHGEACFRQIVERRRPVAKSASASCSRGRSERFRDANARG